MEPKFILKSYDHMGRLIGVMHTRMSEDAARAACAEILRVDKETAYIEMYTYPPRKISSEVSMICIMPQLPW